MKYLFHLLIVYSMISLTSFPFLQSIAQIPVEEFAMNQTCLDSDIKPYDEKENGDDERTKAAEEEFLVYSNASLGFKIEYPKDWKGLEKHCILEAAGIIQTSSTFNFISTSNSSKPGLLGIMIGDFTTDLTMDEFVKVYSEEFSSIIESKEIITLSGQPSAKFIMNDGNNHKLVQITTFSNEKKYDITHPIASWVSNTTLEHMIKSFEIIDNNDNNKNTLDSKTISEANELG
jgi:hypothetical protein